MGRALGVAVAAFLLVNVSPPPVAAAEPAMTWEFATTVASEYWTARGVTIPCVPQPQYLTSDEERALEEELPYIPYTFEDVGTCGVLITPLAEWHRQRAAYAWEYCAAITHELGHLAGLDHSYGDVMEELPMGGTGRIPFGCSHPRQWKVLRGWRKPPRWVRRSPAKVERLWLAGRVWRAQVERARWLRRQ